jgi:hypothetical protein
MQQGLKPDFDSGAFAARRNRLRKNSSRGVKRSKASLRGKNPTHFMRSIGTDKSVPFQNRGRHGVFPQSVKPTLILGALRHD